MEGKALETVQNGNCSIVAVLGDMTAQEVDAIVNAANSHLAHGGGLAGAIVRRGGAVIQHESDALAPIPVGSAVTTSAGDLPCRWVIHAVGPRWGESDEEKKLESAVRSAFDEANRLEARTVALPAISTGIFGYPKQAGTALIVRTINSWLAERPGHSIREVRLTAFDQETADLFAEALRSP
jgi:O-acetyl-ADP-ribose deacetylase (regulator of RNase III)